MIVTKAELDAFCESIVALEDEKKALSDEIKAKKETFAGNQEIDIKSINKFVKAWKEAQKDKDEYVLTDYESDQLILIAFPELSPEAARVEAADAD